MCVYSRLQSIEFCRTYRLDCRRKREKGVSRGRIKTRKNYTVVVPLSSTISTAQYCTLDLYLEIKINTMVR